MGLKIIWSDSIIKSVDESVKNFLIINGFVAFSVALYLLRRSPRQGIRLKMKSGAGKAESETNFMTEKKTYPSKKTSTDPKSVSGGRTSKSLNVIFNYNGHSWDAYEVLGLPAGSSLEKVKEAFEAATKDVDKDSEVFMQTAYQAIVTHHSS